MQGSVKFWIIFFLAAVLLAGVFFFYWETRGGHFSNLAAFSRYLPLSQELKGDLKTVIDLSDALFNTNGTEKTFLVLFQNNYELRPGGGFIGSFGILKVRDGHVTLFQSHDVINFDGRIPDTTPAPYPLPETLKVEWLKLRDSNVSPDWKTNALLAEDFYHQGQGQEQFDGIIGITTDVLSSFLSVTGPVEVPGYPGTYDAEKGIVNLEYQVEQGFLNQNIARGDRKDVMDLLGNIILGKVKALSLVEKYHLFRIALDDLHKKDIQMYLKDPQLEQVVETAGWSGQVDQGWKEDYLMLVDANLSSLKSDYHIKRSLNYEVDLTGELPEVTATVTYVHTAKEKDFMTRDYQTYLRLYVPEGSWLGQVDGNAKPAVFGEDLHRKYFGAIVQVPLGTTKTVTFHYTLPKNIGEHYNLKIEKQAGVNDMPVTIGITEKNENIHDYTFVLNRPFVLNKAQ